MEHKLKTRIINDDLMMICTCHNFIRLFPLTDDMKDAIECFKVHKWAWDEEELRNDLVEETHL